MSHLPERQAEFEKWLFVNIASVLFADKGGELLMLRVEQSELSVGQRIECISALAPLCRYSYMVLCRSVVCARVIIYEPAKVQKALSKVAPWVFDEMGYPRDVGPTEFLEEVGRRWRDKGQIPHEIGFTLGYPIKDVLGYMGLAPLPHRGDCGWRIYGDPDPSLRRSHEFGKARKQAAAWLSM
jgi:hypothetical protein